jgi:hypothetical protein
MKSGAYFSAMLLFWIASIVIGIYLLYPNIKTSIDSVQAHQTDESNQLIKQSIGSNDVELVDFTPLAIFKNL